MMIKFNSEEERLQHPLARKLPKMVLARYFSTNKLVLSNSELQIMMRGLEVLKEIDVSALSDNQKKRLWYAFAYTHPAENVETLMDCAQQLEINENTLFNEVARLFGDLDFFEKVLALFPRQEWQVMIASYDFSIFYQVGTYGHFPILNRLINLVAHDQFEKVIFKACSGAAWNGHLDVLNRLIDLVPPDQLQAMLASNDFEMFRWAAERGHLAILDRLIELVALNKLQVMLASKNFHAFKGAILNGHLDVLNRLIDLVPPDQLQAKLASNDFEMFRWAATYGHLDILNRLIDLLAPAQLQAMLASNNFEAFQLAASNGNLDVLNRLIDLVSPDQLQAMLASNDFEMFRWAATYGHLDILNHFIDVVSLDRLQVILTYNNFSIFTLAADRNHRPVINSLLAFSSVFSYAEMHEYEYGRKYIHPFVAEKLSALRVKREDLSQSDPHAVFDVSDQEEAKLCFYIMRNCIRRSTPENRANPDLLANLNFLLEIPSVKALVHTAVTPGQENELLQLAMAVGSLEVSQRLLAIPAVNELARQHHYYAAQGRGQLDLRALAADKESSVRALSPSEQGRLSRVINHYEPLMEAEGIDNVMNKLRAKLVERFVAQPATIERDDKTRLVLPMEWSSFQELASGLSDEERKRAREAYHQNKDHTAWRYLSKPNPWMDKDASYVYINETHTDRWLTFEEYEALISILYLAAKDEKAQPIDGHTIEGRLTHFIDELAQIGRAHNWDKSRVSQKPGNPLEQYDDLTEGDKPSCFSGVKTRLFQSVVGHPLLFILTESIIEEELRDFVYKHFLFSINNTNRSEFKAAWDDICIDRDHLSEDIEVLRRLNISEKSQAAFIEELKKKYGEQFSDDPILMERVIKAFSLKDDETHATKFAGVGLERLLASSKARSHSSREGSANQASQSAPDSDDMQHSPRN